MRRKLKGQFQPQHRTHQGHNGSPLQEMLGKFGAETEGMTNENLPHLRVPSYGQAPIHDIINNTLLCPHTEALSNYLLRGSTKQLTEKAAEIQSLTFHGPWGLLGRFV